MFHKNLKKYRICQNYTPEHIANELEISVDTYLLWESGEVIPTVDVLPKLSRCLNRDISEFFITKVIKESMESILAALLDQIKLSEELEALWEKNGDSDEYLLKHPERIASYKILKKFFDDFYFEQYINENTLIGFYQCTREQAKKCIEYLDKLDFLISVNEENKDEYQIYFDLPEGVENYVIDVDTIEGFDNLFDFS